MIVFRFLQAMAVCAFAFAEYCGIMGALQKDLDWWMGYMLLTVATCALAYFAQVAYDLWKADR